MPQHSLQSIKKHQVTTLENEMIPLKNLTINSIKTGKDFVLLITNNGLLFGYGNNRNGELGLGLDTQFIDKFTQILNLENKIKILECAYKSNYVVDELNQLYYTGLTYTLFEKEEKKFTFTKVLVDNINEDIKLVRAAHDVIFIITENNLLYVRGRNSGGQLGLGHNNPVYDSFVKNSSLQHIKIKDLKCGDFHSIILDDNGIVYCCGLFLETFDDDNNSDWYTNKFKPLDFLQSKIKCISATSNHSILYSQNNEIIIFGHYIISSDYSVLNLPSGIELKSIYSNGSDYNSSALVTTENKIYIHFSNNGLLLDNDNFFGDFKKLDDSLLLNNLNLPYLYVVGNDHGSVIVIYTDYLINEDFGVCNKNVNLFFVKLKSQLLDFKNSFIDIEFVTN
ncbi:hypothetical protein ABK040_012391 [Willaertia magna]